MHVLVHEEYASQMCTSARKREDRLANLTPELPAYSSSIRGEDPHADTIHLVRTLGGVRTRLFVPLVDPYIRKGGDLRGAALERLASSQRGLREMTSAALIPFVTGREVTSPCGTPASHTTRVSLEEVAHCRLVSPCLGLIRRTASVPNQCASGFS